VDQTGGSAFAPHTIVGAVEPDCSRRSALRPPNARSEGETTPFLVLDHVRIRARLVNGIIQHPFLIGPSHTGSMKVETPVGTMGIRGTAPRVEILNDGSVKFSTLVEEK
jgi:hypothetical protein